MFTTTITLRDAMALIANIVSRFGADYLPPVDGDQSGCIYARIENGRLVPVCIVGQAFSDLGILRAILKSGYVDRYNSVPEQHEACLLDSVMWENAATMGVVFEEDAKQFLRSVQAEQDGRVEWGQAFANGRKRMVEDAERASQPHILAKEYANWSPLADWERELLEGN